MLSVTICLLLSLSLLSGCKSTPEIKYVEKIVEVHVTTPPQLMQECHISPLEGSTVYDYIITEGKLRTDLEVCNEMIRLRNQNEIKRNL
jgi:hypothetical protein